MLHATTTINSSSLGLFVPSLSSSSPDIRPTTASTTLSGNDDWSTFFTMPSTPPVHGAPDDIFSSNWATPLDVVKSATAPMMSHGSSSPTDFAFEAPIDNKTPSTGYSFTPSTGNSYGLPFSGYSSASSFSSAASGSYGGTSFSSADALPAISREFARPSLQQAKRPATAGGLLQSRSPYGSFIAKNIAEETGLFSNPFGSTTKPAPVETVDPHYIPASRRASEGQGAMPPPSWPVPPNDNAVPTQQHGTHSQTQIPSFTASQRQVYAARPQTSDGLPSFGGPTQLPSARSVVGSFSGFSTNPSALQPPAQIRSSYDETSTYRDPRSTYTPSTSRSEGELTFVPIGGPVPKKRPRRRFDEIERLYKCGWSGCEKSYGTLNHLNAHVAMQKHGEKRLPSEFRDMRKAWRKKKREAAAAAANGGQYSGGSWGRSSISSESDFDRRESTTSVMSSASAPNGRFPMTTSSAYTYDSRPTTSSSVASSTDGRAYYPQQNVPPFGYGQSSTGSTSLPYSSASSLQARRDSAPQHVAMPSQPQTMGFRQNDDGITPTPQNPYALPFTASGTLAYHNQSSPHYQQQALRPGSGGFQFQTLTQPMSMSMGSQYGQFAFR